MKMLLAQAQWLGLSHRTLAPSVVFDLRSENRLTKSAPKSPLLYPQGWGRGALSRGKVHGAVGQKIKIHYSVGPLWKYIEMSGRPA